MRNKHFGVSCLYFHLSAGYSFSRRPMNTIGSMLLDRLYELGLRHIFGSPVIMC